MKSCGGRGILSALRYTTLFFQMSFRKSVFGLLGLLLVSEMMAAPVGVEKASIVANRFFDSSLWASKEVGWYIPRGE